MFNPSGDSPILVLVSEEGANSYSVRRFVPADAPAVRDLMVAVVDNGQAAGVAMSGVKIGGKTGTAELSDDGTSHAWFIAFAPADNPVIALAVVVERGGRGGEVAAPIAGQVIKAALSR